MERFVIAITRTCGSGGTTISKQLAAHYGIDMYDRNLLRLASEDSGINEELFARVEESTRNKLLYKVSRKVYNGELISPESNDFVSDQNLFNYQAKVLKELAERESYVCVGRACDYVLKDFSNVLKVFICASDDVCISREMERQGISRKEAEKYVSKNNKYRKEYYKYHTGRIWESPCNYDLCINTGELTYEQSADTIKEIIRMKYHVMR
ncbi:cytidylate kinase-like family protein [Kineothrix sedimenti]|uniref:Cytidylate kinase-like family protein n=1 Tax=Kineothrix sedimenti TaxID=3123317 RepID=A0ABZ3EZ71_9FIRM